MFMTTDDALAGYLANVLSQMKEWLTTGNVQKLVLVITSQETGEPLERWVFDLQTDRSVGADDKVQRDEKEIKAEIAAIQRQITASVTFLPLNDEPCAFDLLVYTDDDVEVPKAWEESDPKVIQNSDEVSPAQHADTRARLRTRQQSASHARRSRLTRRCPGEAALLHDERAQGRRHGLLQGRLTARKMPPIPSHVRWARVCSRRLLRAATHRRSPAFAASASSVQCTAASGFPRLGAGPTAPRGPRSIRLHVRRGLSSLSL